MEFKVVPFLAKIGRNDNSATVATQMQTLIDDNVNYGWEYLRMDSVETSVAEDKGCFGFGSSPAYIKYYKVLIFRK